MKNSTKKKEDKLGEDFQIGSPEEIKAYTKFEKQFIESSEPYSLAEIADKLIDGGELNEIERHTAAAAVRDWLRIKEAQKGQPRKFADERERWRHNNNKRRDKSCDCSFCGKEKEKAA